MKTDTNVESFFDAYAGDFNAIYGTKNTFVNNLVNRFFRKSMRVRFEKTIEGCRPIEGATVIDIGCGPGHYSVALAAAGAGHVLGVDFADGMIALAKQNAEAVGVQARCEFVTEDFLKFPAGKQFDYVIVMGFMDYIDDPRPLVEKVISLTKRKAFFSFPLDGGFLAWQRKLRYKQRCDLIMYDLAALRKLFSNLQYKNLDIEKISRDAFVTVVMG